MWAQMDGNMICELYNKMIKYNGDIMGTSVFKENEVNLLMFILMVFCTVFFTVTLAWWVLPLKRVKFRCDK